MNYSVRQCPVGLYLVGFDQRTGAFVRLGKDNSDPFCSTTGPELLDISITNYCERNCGFCYRASHQNGHHMPFEDYEGVISQAAGLGVLQVALGGGNPNQHPDFIRILETTRGHGVVPSYTTNGRGMTDDVYLATKDHCGALAVSWYEPCTDALGVLDKASKYGIKTNIHFLLSKTTLPLAIDLMSARHDVLDGANALVFLNYKPIHSSPDLCLSDSSEVRLFFDAIRRVNNCKIGFDSCMISYLPLLGQDLVKETVDYCEAGRFSAFVSEDMLFYPCSFMNDVSENGVDLKVSSLRDGWLHGEDFASIRRYLTDPGSKKYAISACGSCGDYDLCRGGCPIFDINRCRGDAAA